VPEFRHEVQACGKCGGPTDVVVEEQVSSQGIKYGRIIHEFRCRRGCTGRGVVD
jgi:hypothetical protein